MRLKQIDIITQLLRQLAQNMGTLRGPDDLKRVKSCPKCEQSRMDINRHLSEVATIDEMALHETELLSYVNNFFKNGLFWPVDKKLEYLDFVNTQLEVYKNRLSELVAAAMDSEKINTLKQYLITLKVEGLAVEEVHNEKNEVIAWHMRYSTFKNA